MQLPFPTPVTVEFTEASLVNTIRKMSMDIQKTFQARIMDSLNRECARRGRGMLLPIPQPHPFGHCAFVQYEWKLAETTHYLESGTLPQTLSTIHPLSKAVALWMFAASTTAGLRFLPELELEVKPDFQNMPALCMIDMGKDRFKQQQIALVPSEFLECVPTQNRTVRYILKDGRTIDLFTTRADMQSLEALEAKILGNWMAE